MQLSSGWLPLLMSSNGASCYKLSLEFRWELVPESQTSYHRGIGTGTAIEFVKQLKVVMMYIPECWSWTLCTVLGLCTATVKCSISKLKVLSLCVANTSQVCKILLKVTRLRPRLPA